MKGAKFKVGQEVRTVNDSHRTVIVSITKSDRFYYDVEHYNKIVVHRIPESDLLPYKGKK